MADTSIIKVDAGELSKPANTLVKKASDALGGIFKPWQIRRVARAEAEAELIRAKGTIEISELAQRAVHRFILEEEKHQQNIEEITAKALPQLQDDARPEDINDDWLANFFAKCRIVSDEEMQALWSKVLSGEANAPGTFSTRTVNLISSLDKRDAAIFTRLCSFVWRMGSVAFPLMLDVHHSLYESNGLHFVNIEHLDDIGLISFNVLSGYERKNLPQHVVLNYFDETILVDFKEGENHRISLGHAIFTQAGRELQPIAAGAPMPDFIDYAVSHWTAQGCVLSSPWPRRKAGLELS